MNLNLKRGLWAMLLIIAVIAADQTLKIWIKTHFYLGEEHEIFSWFRIKFIENNGMAFGMELWSKVLLTAIRICAVAFLLWLLHTIRDDRRVRTGALVAVALITAGAAGNIFDCVFYGRIFTNPYPPLVAHFTTTGGYAPWFEGHVVDMLYFPFFSFTWPSWMPLVGGNSFEFFQYIFNIADSSICVGVFLLLIFYSKDFYEMLHVVTGKMRLHKEASPSSQSSADSMTQGKQ